jgi:glutamate/tyrosine decarboxylase-like PLP-dependent enzyme
LQLLPHADDDQEAGFPDLLGRSIRTSRRPDVLKMAVTFQALGWSGLAELTDRCCEAATLVADLISERPGAAAARPAHHQHRAVPSDPGRSAGCSPNHDARRFTPGAGHRAVLICFRRPECLQRRQWTEGFGG